MLICCRQAKSCSGIGEITPSSGIQRQMWSPQLGHRAQIFSVRVMPSGQWTALGSRWTRNQLGWAAQCLYV
jgi:hypothetical protein